MIKTYEKEEQLSLHLMSNSSKVSFPSRDTILVKSREEGWNRFEVQESNETLIEWIVAGTQEDDGGCDHLRH